MIDARSALHAALAQWYGVRARVRALGAKLAAAQHALGRDARRESADPELHLLVDRLASERAAIDALARDVDERIAHVERECRACRTRVVDELTTNARSGRHTPAAPP